ncbi:MAG TPA: hypothetical protein GX719_13755, partial [Gammaproteobacteria bacterium]|nr:hypothetical protein [Gammaproteobacteria bacterium]
FVISITDANGQTSNDTLNVLITDTDPVAKDEAHTLVGDSGAYTVSGNTLTNDSAFDGPVAFNGWTSTTGQYGSFTANTDGTYSYVLDNTNAAVNALNQGQSLTENFSYQVRDADGDVDSATVTITINGRTDGPPVVDVPDDNGVAAGNISIAEDATAAVTGQITVTAEAGVASLQVGGQTLTLADLNALGTTPAIVTTTKGELTLTGYDAITGKVDYSYTVNGAQDHTPDDDGDDSVLDSFVISITDANGQTSNDTLDVLITDTDPVAEPESHTLVEDSGAYTVSGNTLTNDTAFDGPVAFNGWQGSTAAQYGTFTANSDGTYSYVLDNTNPAVNALNDGQTLTETFKYQVRDTDGDLAEATVTIDINGRTDGPPVVDVPDDNGVDAGNISIAEDATAAVTGQITVTAEAGVASLQVGGQTLTLAELNALGTEPAIVTTAKGELTLTGYDAVTGKVDYSYTVNGAQDHTDGDVIDSFAISITDANGQTSNDTLDVLITDTKPVAEGELHTLVEDSGAYTVSGNTLTNDSAFDGPVAFKGWTSTTGQYGSFTANADGTYSYVLDNTNPAVNALNDLQTLTETFSYQVRDADGDVAEASVTIIINGHTDGPPVVEVPDNIDAEAGNISIAEDATAAVSGHFTVTAEAGVATVKVGATTLNSAQLGDLGDSPITITTTKGELTLTGYDARTGEVSYSYTVNGAQDHTDGDVIDSFDIIVTDSLNQTSSDTLNVLITDTDPVATDEEHTIVKDSDDYAVEGNVLDNDTAFDGPVAFDSWDSDTTGNYGTFTANDNGTYRYVLNNADPRVNALNDGQTLTETFKYQVRDTDGDLAEASVIITINGRADGPPVVEVPDNNDAQAGNISI